jgi:hypothetical protein
MNRTQVIDHLRRDKIWAGWVLVLLGCCTVISIFHVTSSYDFNYHRRIIVALSGGGYYPHHPGPLYYLPIALVNSILEGVGVAHHVQVAIKITQSLYLLVSLVLMDRILALLNIRNGFSVLVVGCFFLVPGFLRLFFMVRPETLLLIVFLLVLWLELKRERSQDPHYELLIGLVLAVGMIQKANFAVVVFWYYAYRALRAGRSRESWRELMKLNVVPFVLLFALLEALHVQAGGLFFSQHQADDMSAYRRALPPLSFLYTWSPTAMWEAPCREEQRGSMLNILSLHLFGDYWSYDLAPNKLDRATKIVVNRFGLMVSVLFGSLIVGTLAMGRKTVLRWTTLEHRLLTILPLSLLFLYAVALRQFDPRSANLTKWTYLPAVFPALAIVVGLLARRWSPALRRVAQILMVLILLGSLFQFQTLACGYGAHRYLLGWLGPSNSDTSAASSLH